MVWKAEQRARTSFVSGSPARYFARIVRAVVVSSLGVGGGFGLLCFIAVIVLHHGQNAVPAALQFGIGLGLGFAVFWATMLLLWDLTCRLQASKGLTYEIWELDQTRIVQFDGSLRDARSLSRQALLAVPYIKAVADEDDQYQIRAGVGPSWKSAGENMQVVIAPRDTENSWTITCKSSPLSSNIAFDYGKNFENVEAWVRSMNKLMGKATLAHIPIRRKQAKPEGSGS